MEHHCKDFILHCMDFRLGRPLKEFLEKQGILGDCDIVSVAGGVKSLLSPKDSSDRDFVLNQIDISVNLHKVSEIILSNHTDCGAYGGRLKFASFEEECEFHISEIRKAKEIVLKTYPQLDVRMLLGKILLSGQVQFEEIRPLSR